jgi:Mg-chelatase subunit ChlD
MSAARARIRHSVGIIGVLSAALVAQSCSKSGDESRVSGDGGSSPSKVGGAGASNSSGSLNIGGSVSEHQAGAGSTEVSKDDACATSSDRTEALPPVVQLVVDTSGSMDWPPGWAPTSPDDSKPPGATKWEITREALLASVASLAGDIALGASFYPSVQQEGDTCLANDVAVPIALLGPSGSAARSGWESELSAVVPVGATPTHGAYLFGLAQLVASKLPGNQVILLITDGTPTCTLDCVCTEDNLPVDSQPLIDEAAQAFDSGVRTFVIGSPGSEETRDVLSRLATEGGTAPSDCSDAGPKYCHFDMTTEPDLATGLRNALEEIATRVRSCEYPIPTPPAGQALDPDLVNVLYTPDGGDAETIARDASPSDCSEGWQYSRDGASIVLCGAACDRVRADPTGAVEVLFGCETVVTKPK